MIDFRSDTITKPTADMLQAMLAAEVGDDVFGDDPTVNELESKAADMFGMEAGLFCVSGTMANQIGIQVHTTMGGQVICDHKSHVYLYEGGGIAKNAGCSVNLLHGERGLLSAELIEASLQDPHDIHFPKAQLVVLENTMNKGGGACYSLKTLKGIRDLCIENHLKLHLDGARLFNAIIARKQKPEDFGKLFDTISICLSKGLGCPVGSLLLGSKDSILQARRIRKVMGGGWRQAGYLAAAGIYALENHIERLKDDHIKAQKLAQAIAQTAGVKKVQAVETNIVIFETELDIGSKIFVEKLAEKRILAVPFGSHLVRLVTHLDISEKNLNTTLASLPLISF